MSIVLSTKWFLIGTLSCTQALILQSVFSFLEAAHTTVLELA
jgi:hypothetical protein